MSNGEQESTNTQEPTHYIGIGASAGGLEALQTLLQNLPTDTGACFIIVQHLSPDFKSMMLELLSKHTSMHIQNVTDGIEVQSNTIYLIPPKKNMVVEQGKLLLSDKNPESGLNLPIDVFFRSLSEDQQHKAIGIILSGTGSDGSRGIKALKEAGALVIAQEPDSAKFDGMPNSAINTGIVDLILRPEDMGSQLQKYIQHPLVSGKFNLLRGDLEDSQDSMAEILELLKSSSDIEFSKYKPSTVARRIERRMTIHQVTSLKDYLNYLYQDKTEVQILSRELLIGVTRFFRDDAAFESLEKNVIPEIVRNSTFNDPIRIWVAACSSGEEAYSIAMLFDEELTRQGVVRDVKVFATDVNPDAISDASNGVYNAEILQDVNQDRLSKYFSHLLGSAYKVNKRIRQMVVFATHNMLVDPPFSKIDLVTCRNVLIYFQHNAQKRALTSIHFALDKGGYLFLGSSENLGVLSEHFDVVDERFRIFKKSTNVRIPLNAPHNQVVSSYLQQGPKATARANRLSAQITTTNTTVSNANLALINQYAPPSILLDENNNAIHVHGDVRSFIHHIRPGRISTAINDIINDDLNIAVNTALQRAQKEHEEVFYTGLSTVHNGVLVKLNIRVKRANEIDIEGAPNYYWVIFEVIDEVTEDGEDMTNFNLNEQSKQRIDDLELELKLNKEHLQVTVEELETTNEELQSANEELMSANEELQSTNEELQSVNEELYTVNTEYQVKITEISQANDDLDEVLNLSKIGIIFLDENMLIRRYTHAATEYINLLETDINRPIHHFSKNIQYDSMLNDVADVFSSGEAKEHEFTLPDKRVLRITINPYRYNEDNKGVAITFSDISTVKYTEMGMAVAYKQLRQSINNALETLDSEPFDRPIHVLVLDDNEVDLALLEERIKDIKKFNIEVFSANNIQDANQLVQRQPIDVCIADYYLNEDTALQFIDELQAINIDVPVIVVTGDVSGDLSPILLSHGVLDLISKPDLSTALIERSIRFAIRRKEIDQHIGKYIGSNE